MPEAHPAPGMARAVVDANVWNAAVINLSGVNAKLLDALMAKEFVLVMSQEVLDELFGVLMNSEAAQRRGFTEQDARDTIRYFDEVSFHTRITGELVMCSHAADDKLIETAIRGRASVIVSQDAHLTDPELAPGLDALGIRVLSPREFLDLIGHR